MKTKLLSLSLAFISIFSACQTSIDELVEESTPSRFCFPEREDWVYLETNEERYGALQIPENLLTILSSQELAEACMTYPLGSDCLFYNEYQMGIAHVVTHFNGFPELKKQPDAFDKVLDFYNKDLNSIAKITDKEEFLSRTFHLYYEEQFIISGYLMPVDQLKNYKKLIDLYHKAEKLRKNNKELCGCTSLNSLDSMKEALGLK
ncbi:MAG: hypothetical protein HDR74_09400 [Bacteroides sp.]|nr:hypothetical protein [Bacteroides sp.]